MPKHKVKVSHQMQKLASTSSRISARALGLRVNRGAVSPPSKQDRPVSAIGRPPAIGPKQKAEIAFLLVSFLDAKRQYEVGEIDAFIARNVKRTILGRQGYSIDHFRRAMIDNGYLDRQSDGSRYWVERKFLGPNEQEQANLAALNTLVNTAPTDKVVCPYCRQRFSKTVVLQHYTKRHSLEGYWQKRLDRYFD